MANVCPGGPPVPNEPTTLDPAITVTPNVPQPIYSVNGTGPFPQVAWPLADEFCSLQFTVTPGNQLIVPSTQWNVNWLNPDNSVGTDAGTQGDAIQAGFGVAPDSSTPITGPATSGPIVVGTNTVTVTIVSGTIRVSMGNGSTFGYFPGDPVTNAVIKYEWANPVHGLNHVYFDSGTNQTPTGITNYQASASVPPSASNLQCFLGPDGLRDIQDTQANLHGSGDNIPPGNALWIAVGTSPGGPYASFFGPLGPGVIGNNTVGQPVQNIFTGLTPSTQYYYRTEERVNDNGANPGTLVSSGSECTFTTKAGTATDYINCDLAGLDSALNRNRIISAITNGPWPLSIDAGFQGYTVEHSTSALGPWTVSTLYGTDSCTDTGNPQGFAFPGSAYEFGPLLHNTVYFTRITYNKGNGQPDEVHVCGPHTITYDYTAFACQAPTNITTTSADVHFTVQNAGFPDNTPPCNDDQYTVRYGTTPGGPYPLSQTTSASVATNPNFSLAGLLPNTTYYYILEAAEQEEVPGGIFNTTAECQFTTLPVGPPPPSAAGTPATAITPTGATTNGTLTNPPAGGFWEIHLGPSGGPYTTVLCPNTPNSGASPENVSCPATGLTPNTQYCYLVVSKDSGLNVVATSPVQTCFTTAAAPPVVVTTDPPGPATGDCVTLNGTSTNAPVGCTYQFKYGNTPGGPYGSTVPGTPPLSTGASPEAFTAQVCGLGPSHTIYYKAEVVCGGNPTDGAEVPTSTLAIIMDPCEAATNVTPLSATLHATSENVPAGYTYQFRYGTTPGGPYPFTVSGGPSSGGTPDPYQANVVGLTPGTTYYYTAEVLNPAQQVVAGGGECSFATTGAIGPGGFVYWCGQLYDSANCTFVPSNGGGYFDCNQA